MRARAASSAGRLERWLTEPFERAGWRGIARRMMLLTTVGAVSWGVVLQITGSLGGGIPLGEALWIMLANTGVILAGLATGAWVQFRDVRKFEAWESAGRPSAEAARILHLLLTAPYRTVNWAIVVYLALAIPTIYAWYLAIVEPLAFAIVFCLAGFLAATIVIWPVAVFAEELSMRPMIARVCAEFPHLAAPEGQGMSLRTKALLPVPAVTLTTGIMAGVLAGLFDEPIEQVGAAVVISLAFSAVMAAILRFAVTEAALRPVDDLIEGVERISRGDLGSRVPITGADELAVLGRAVNDMTGRLAAHDAEMRASRARIVSASDEARRKVERDLHDGAQQYLVLLELKLGLMSKAAADDPEMSALAAEVREDLARALAELRDLAHGIYPAVLETDGLPAALQAAAERSSLPVTVDVDGVGRSRPEVEAAVYFCCLEALQNSSKHAGDGATATVRLAQSDSRLLFEVVDDGVGYDAEAVGASAGLQNMVDRIGALGGELHVSSEPAVGTTVAGSVPAF